MRLDRLATCMVCTAFFMGTSHGNPPALRILNWEAFLSERTISQWEARTGATVNQIYFDNEENRNSVLISYDQVAIDLVVIDQITAPMFGRRGILLPTAEYRDTPNLRHIDPLWNAQCGEYSTPYMWGTMGLLYRKDMLALPPHSWSDLLSPASELTGHIGLLEDDVDSLAPPLLQRGASITTADKTLLAQAFEDLRSLLPAVLTFEYPITFVGDNPNANELHLALGYSGDQYELNELSGADVWDYVIPEEGTLLWVDCLAVLANSPNKALAFDFIDFINQPDVAAANSEALHVATPNASALPLQSEAFRSNTLIYPDKATRAKSQNHEPVMDNDNVRLRNRITSSLVHIHESQ